MGAARLFGLALVAAGSPGCGGGGVTPLIADDAAMQAPPDVAVGPRDLAMGCGRDADCAPGQVCDTSSHVCVACLVDRDCPPGARCVSRVCVPGCSPTHGCGDAGTCEPDAGICVECLRDRDCRDPKARHCDPAERHCVACLPDNLDDCGPATFCAPVDGGTACEPGCKNDADCAGMPGLPRCDLPSHQCVVCLGDQDCAAGKVCMGKTCVPGCTGQHACPNGLGCCNAVCLDLTGDANNCGACGMACAAPAASCCGGACVDLGGDPRNCGACGAVCRIPNATPVCAMQTCAIGVCNEGWADCNTMRDDGCEVSLLNDSDNCGKCGHSCVVPHATALCGGGACVIAACEAGFRDCNHVSDDGCEVDVRADPMNCGVCGNLCTMLPHATATCVASTCVVASCAVGFADCNKLDPDGCESQLDSDPANCGGCGMACPAPANMTATCTNSVCGQGGCKAGFGDCNQNLGDGCEVNLNTDAANCGACGNACAAASACITGKCTSLYGSGSAGNLTVNANTAFANYSETHLSVAAVAGATSLSLASATGFSVADKILIVNVRSNQGNDGKWELADVTSVNGNTIKLGAATVNAYPEPANTLVRTVPQYADVSIAMGVTLSAKPWVPNTLSGGIIAFYASGSVTVNGTISASGAGYQGGVGNSDDPVNNQYKTQGESYTGLGKTDLDNNVANAGGGAGGAKRGGCEGGGGGGGGYGAAGSSGGRNDFGCPGTIPGGVGGGTYGDAQLTRIYFGSGGGSGGYTTDPAQGAGGSGGGMILIMSPKVTVNGGIESRGSAGTTEFKDYGGGGGGSGGSIYLRTQQAVANQNRVVVSGGNGGAVNGGGLEVGGAGAVGRVSFDLRP